MPRFDSHAREAVRRARGFAAGHGTRRTGCEHLVYALFADEGSTANTLTGNRIRMTDLERGFVRARRRGGIGDDEERWLRGLGIDVDTLVQQVEARFGAGALDPSAATSTKSWPTYDSDVKQILVGSLREAQETRDRRIGERHLLLALLREHGTARQVLGSLGVTYPEVRSGRPDSTG